MDVYEEAIAYLTAHPDRIQHAWCNPDTAPGGCLFHFCSVTREDTNISCGCLVLIRGSNYSQVGSESPDAERLSKEIRADERLPVSLREITVETLPVFAEWQRKLDQVWNRPLPVMQT